MNWIRMMITILTNKCIKNDIGTGHTQCDTYQVLIQLFRAFKIGISRKELYGIIDLIQRLQKRGQIVVYAEFDTLFDTSSRQILVLHLFYTFHRFINVWCVDMV